MDGYQKTENLKLNKITGDMVVDIEPIDENFSKIDEKIGNITDITIEDYSTNTNGSKSVANLIKYIYGKIGAIELNDTKVNVSTWKNSTLDTVLGKLKTWVGELPTLKTRDKTSMVGAINENFDDIKAIKDAEILDRKSINTLNSEITGIDNLLKEDNEKFAQILGVSIDTIRRGV